jgi:hypothetical protein
MNAQFRAATPVGAAVCDDGGAGYPEVTASSRGDGDYRTFTAGKPVGLAWARKPLTAATRQPGRASSDDGRRPENPSVTGKPLLWLRAEGLTLFTAALLLYSATHQHWWLVPAVILLPDLFMVGYVGGSRLGAAVYNLGHSYPLPALTSLAGLAGHHPLVLALGLLWLAHIGMDRLAGFGLKYDTGFQRTHLSGLAGTVIARPRPVQPPSGSLPASAGRASGPVSGPTSEK